MLIISQNARLAHLPIPKDAVLRVNVAWVKSVKDLDSLLTGIQQDVFLDFPEGRNKPPKPVLVLEDLLTAMKRYERIRYFGVTNVKAPEAIEKLKTLVPSHVQLVPKIESVAGVKRLADILATLSYAKKFIMLDKEDLYTDLHHDNEGLERCVREVRDVCRGAGVEVLELAGVIFESHREN
jgi:hypothetical protein